jgi:hypothetical protein
METENIVQFVWFETAVNNFEFMSQWDEYSKEMKKVQAIKLQQEVGNKKNARYLSQHSCVKDDFMFVFKKGRRSAHSPEVEMKVRQLGGYIRSQMQCKNDSKKDESKIFIFINGTENNVDLLNNFLITAF